MTRDRWQRVEQLFHRAVDLEPETRSRFLDTECGEDTGLRAELERLVRDDATPDPVLDGSGAVPEKAGVDPMLGCVVGNYRLTEVIGAGGMGVVYAAERADGLFEQEVAVKLVRAPLAAPDLLRRFARERRALAALNHPNIARLYDGGTTGEGIPYLVMERVDGVPIDRWCDERRLAVADRLRLFAEVARTVHHAHTNLVVHRDLKPSNVLVDASGRPRLLDFGIAWLLDREGDDSTRTVTQLMTPEFASPEQLAGATVTTATDVYSLGVVLYVLLTGRRPYHCTSQSPAEWERLVAERPPTRPSTAVRHPMAAAGRGAPGPQDPRDVAACFGTTPARLGRRLAGDLDRIVLMALRKEPERRYTSAQELAEDVERHLAGFPVRAREDSIGYRIARFSQRNRAAVIAGTAMIVALVAGTALAWRGERRARVESVLAAQQAERATDEAQRADEQASIAKAQAALALDQAEHARIESESAATIAAFLQDQVQAQLDMSKAGEQERIAAAEAMLLRQAEQARRQYPDQPHLRANVLDALGRYAIQLGRFPVASDLIDEALGIRKAEFGPESLEVALSLASRGFLLYSQGRFREAEPVMRRRLDLHRTLPTGTHTDVALAANDLAAILRNLGKLDEAEDLQREALALRRAEDPGGLAVAESLNNLATIELSRERPAEAVDLLTEALAIRRAVLGNAHPLTAQTLSNLANACIRAGDVAQGRAHFAEAERELREIGSVGRSELALVVSDVAGLELAEGHADTASARIDEALALLRAAFPPGHPSIIRLMERRAELLDLLRRDDEAAAAWDDVVAARRASLAPNDPELARTLRAHTVFLTRVGRLEDARAELVEAVGIHRTGAPNPAELGRAEVSLGIVLSALGRRAEGLEHARAGLALLSGVPEASPAELEWARRAAGSLGSGE